jgi:CheY-like chemotaxis protein
MRILVADDSVAAREAISRLLIAAGHQVVEAEDGAAAITTLIAERPDVLLLDLNMPRVTGWVVCRLIKEDPNLARIPVLVLTALDGEEDRYWAERSGADGVISKADMAAGLMEQIQAVEAGRALADLSGIIEPASGEGETDVLARVCEILDRKLFEETVVNDINRIGLQPLDLRESLEEALSTLRHLVPFDLGAVGVLPGRLISIHAARPADPASLKAFRDRVAGELIKLGGAGLTPDDLNVAVEFAPGVEVEGPARQWQAWRVSPLQARGRVLGVVVLAAEAPERFGDRVDHTLRAVIPAVSAVADAAARYQRTLESV